MSYQTNVMDPKHAASFVSINAHQYGENVDPNINGAINQFQGMTITNGMSQVGAGPGYLVPQSQEGPFVLAPVPGAGHPMSLEQLGHAAAYAHANPYLGGHSQLGSYIPYPMMPYTPGRSGGFQDRINRAGHAGQGEVPGLENRRGSYSTTESTPATPFYGGMAKHDHGPRVAVHDRSTYTTPSPQQLGQLNVFQDATNKQSVITIPVDRNLDELLLQSPAVPKAVPAVFTPSSQMKSLDQSLENRIPGNRNVYIRGLHPTTDDELLYKFTSRFGDVETSKAIIDTSTGACKGCVSVLSPGIVPRLTDLHAQLWFCQVLRCARLGDVHSRLPRSWLRGWLCSRRCSPDPPFGFRP